MRDGTAGPQLAPERAARDETQHDCKRERSEQRGARALAQRLVHEPKRLFAARCRFTVTILAERTKQRCGLRRLKRRPYSEPRAPPYHGYQQQDQSQYQEASTDNRECDEGTMLLRQPHIQRNEADHSSAERGEPGHDEQNSY